MTKLKIGINGFGRIGRAVFRAAINHPSLEIVAINDLADTKTLSYLLAYDSVYGRLQGVSFTETSIKFNGREIPNFSKNNPAQIPWSIAGVDIVVECTGLFTNFSDASGHLRGGAKHVIISAPGRGDGLTILAGINTNLLATKTVTSNGSCTTNAVAPILSILSKNLGVKKAVLNTTHSYTASQSIVDGARHLPDKLRRSRAAAINMIPTSTSATVAVTDAMPEFTNLFDGLAVRVPTPAVSLADITLVTGRPTSVDEINTIFINAIVSKQWRGILDATNDPVVSADMIGNSHASVADLSMTRVVGGDLVKVLAWYDNEVGYANTLLHHALEKARFL